MRFMLYPQVVRHILVIKKRRFDLRAALFPAYFKAFFARRRNNFKRLSIIMNKQAGRTADT